MSAPRARISVGTVNPARLRLQFLDDYRAAFAISQRLVTPAHRGQPPVGRVLSQSHRVRQPGQRLIEFGNLANHGESASDPLRFGPRGTQGD